MSKALIFAGTKDGRELAERLLEHNIETHICVATAYGEEIVKAVSKAVIHQGRLNCDEMEALIEREGFHWIIDATHPFAQAVSIEIKRACVHSKKEYLRLLRNLGEEYEGYPAYFAATHTEAVDWINKGDGTVLLTTGSKDLEIYTTGILNKERIYARVLAESTVVEHCRALGLSGRQIICMQGPFSEELNYAMIKQLEAKYLVTKETGPAGGFSEKVKAAQRAGIKLCIIKRPEEEGLFLNELLKKLGIMQRQEMPSMAVKMEITLLGIGMGTLDGLTRAGYRCCEETDLIIGAPRMLKALAMFQKPTKALYQSEEIIHFLEHERNYSRILIVLSGDIGFYSGAAKIIAELKDSSLSYHLKLECGISSLAYFSARLCLPWEDMCLISRHGRKQNLIGAVRKNEKVFTLTEGAAGVRQIAEDLLTYHMPELVMHVGNQLGYDAEMIETGSPQDFTSYDRAGLCVVLLQHPGAAKTAVTQGLADEAFIRGDVPMTKEEVRAVSLAKLKLTRAAVIYDIGAGTGSVAVECALAAEQGLVFAIEKKEEAVKLLYENKHRHQVENLLIIHGKAPEAMQELPPPTHAFIGGSGGNLEAIVALLLQKNRKVRIVINAITLETLSEIMTVVHKNKIRCKDIVQLAISKGRMIGGYHMMMGQNPVYVVTLEGRDE